MRLSLPKKLRKFESVTRIGAQDVEIPGHLEMLPLGEEVCQAP